MGGSSGGTFKYHTPTNLAKQVRRAEDDTTVAAFEAELNGLVSDILASSNERDVDLVRDRLDEVKAALQGVIEGSFDQLFGGSVAKHTYVDGLSDIDSLLLVNGSDLEKDSPQKILVRLGTIARASLRDVAEITTGQMAVTIRFNDGMVLQVLPAIKADDGTLRVPSSRRDGWSHIDPEAFRTALTKRNQECGGKLVPTIKLAKSIIGQMPEAQRLSGYHVESLAIAAFRHYEGQKTTAAMLPTFFERARDLVLNPIQDSTGQSVHVDAYLGAAGSVDRVAAGHILGRIAKRMRNATAAGSAAQWRAILDSDV
jgi:hypothetical protein